MFDVGFSEIMLIHRYSTLIVVGPERLPKLARTAGHLDFGKARTIVTSVRSEVERELRVEELKKSIQRSDAGRANFKQLAGARLNRSITTFSRWGRS